MSNKLRELFASSFPLSHKELGSIWSTAIIVLDTNILLNLYRYSEETRDEYLTLLEKLQDRLWLPYHVATEFFTDRIGIILGQAKQYTQLTNDIEKIKDQLHSERHPYLSKPLLSEYDALHRRIVDELSAQQKEIRKRVQEDKILKTIESIFGSRIGTKHSRERIAEMCARGQARYDKQIPPGFKDASKGNADDPDDILRYGDYIIWCEILEYCKANALPLIFVTDDSKEDWWHITDGQTIGPRPELIKEFHDECLQLCHFYSGTQFSQHAGRHVSSVLSPSATSEIEKLAKRRHESDWAMQAVSWLGHEFGSVEALIKEHRRRAISNEKRLMEIHESLSIENAKIHNEDQIPAELHRSIQRRQELLENLARFEGEVANGRSRLGKLEAKHARLMSDASKMLSEIMDSTLSEDEKLLYAETLSKWSK